MAGHRNPHSHRTRSQTSKRATAQHRGHVSRLSPQVSTVAIQRAVSDPTAAQEQDLLAMQSLYGNEAVSGLLAGGSSPAPASGPPIQAKLRVGPVGDRYEQEADRVAGEVVDSPSPVPSKASSGDGGVAQRQELPEEELQMKSLAATITPLVQRQALPEEEELQMKSLSSTIMPLVQRQPEEEELQMKSLSSAATPLVQRQLDEEELQMRPLGQWRRTRERGFLAGDTIERQLARLRGQGAALPSGFLSEMEQRFGADLSGVRVHSGHEAAQLNQSLRARAFTHGADIYFGSSAYDPSSRAGRRLLAHELTHVVQQGAARRTRRDGVGRTSTVAASRGIQRRERKFLDHSSFWKRGWMPREIGKDDEEEKKTWDKREGYSNLGHGLFAPLKEFGRGVGYSYAGGRTGKLFKSAHQDRIMADVKRRQARALWQRGDKGKAVKRGFGMLGKGLKSAGKGIGATLAGTLQAGVLGPLGLLKGTVRGGVSTARSINEMTDSTAGKTVTGSVGQGLHWHYGHTKGLGGSSSDKTKGAAGAPMSVLGALSSVGSMFSNMGGWHKARRLKKKGEYEKGKAAEIAKELGRRNEKTSVKGLATSTLGAGKGIYSSVTGISQAAGSTMAHASKVAPALSIATGGIDFLRGTYGGIRAAHKARKLSGHAKGIEGYARGQLQAGNQQEVDKAKKLREVAKYSAKRKRWGAAQKFLTAGAGGLAVAGGIAGLALAASNPVGWALAGAGAAVGLGLGAYKLGRGAWKRSHRRGKLGKAAKAAGYDLKGEYGKLGRGRRAWNWLTGKDIAKKREMLSAHVASNPVTSNDDKTLVGRALNTKKARMSEELVNQISEGDSERSKYAKKIGRTLGILSTRKTGDKDPITGEKKKKYTINRSRGGAKNWLKGAVSFGKWGKKDNMDLDLLRGTNKDNEKEALALLAARKL